jgi:hypothetical protein
MTDPLPSKECDLPTLMAWLRERHSYLVGLGAKETYEGYIHAHIERLQGMVDSRDRRIAILLRPRPAPEPPAALDKGGIMQLVQEFASTWSLVGGRFDNGTMLEEANKRLEEIRSALDGIKVVGAAQPPRDGQ